MDTVLNSCHIVEENIVIIITMQYYTVQPSVKVVMCTTVWSDLMCFIEQFMVKLVTISIFTVRNREQAY